MAQSLSGMMLYLSQPKFAANSVANELRIWIFGQIYVLKWWMVSQEQKQIAQNLKIENRSLSRECRRSLLRFQTQSNAMFESEVVTSDIDWTSFDFLF